MQSYTAIQQDVEVSTETGESLISIVAEAWH